MLLSSVIIPDKFVSYLDQIKFIGLVFVDMQNPNIEVDCGTNLIITLSPVELA